MSKKERRLESKKKKAIALLNLIETKVPREGAMEGPAAKKACYGNDDRSTDNKTDQSPSCAESSGIVQKPGLLQLSDDAETTDNELRYAKAKQLQRQMQLAADEESRHTQQVAVKYGPKIQLCLENLLPFMDLSDKSKGSLEDRLPPLFIINLQHLLLLALLKNFSFWTPRWCRLSRPRKLSSVVLVVLKDISVRDVEEHPDCFPFLKKSFLSCVEMVNPAQYNSSVEQDMCRVPLLISQLKCYTKREDIRQKIVKLISNAATAPPKDKESTEKLETRTSDCQAGDLAATQESQRLLGLSEGSEQQQQEQQQQTPADNFPRTSLLLSSVQLMEEGYPLPVDIRNKRYSGYAFSKDSYKPATQSSPLFGVDCEMCQTVREDFELTRVSVVNEEKEVVYDQLVKPDSEITNYLTRFSGMTAEKLSSVTKRVEDVHKELKELLPPDAILCGQSLWNDLNALKMFHPYVIDTSIIFNQSGDKKVKCGLRKLAFNFLGRKIQTSNQGHCSIEDAKATMDLVKLKLSKDIEFGDAMLGGVYFPNIKTYFQDPSKAQNVEEVFSAPSVSAPTPPNMHHLSSSSSSCPSPPSSSFTDQQNKSIEQRNGVCVCSPSVCVENGSCVPPRTNGSAAHCEQGGREERCGGRTACGGGVCEGRKEEVGVVEERSGNCGEDSGRQREVFFQQEGSTVMFNLFELLADNGKSAGVVGSQELFSRLAPSPKVERVEVGSSSEACSAAVRVSQHRDLTWVELKPCPEAPSGGQSCDGAAARAGNRQEFFSQLDGHVQELVSKLQPQSLVAIVMSGCSEEGQHFNAATFLKVT